MWKHESPLMPVLWILLALIVGYLLICYAPDLLADGIVVAGVLIGLAVLFVIVYPVYWLISNRASRVIRTEARVVRRRKKDWDISLVGDTPETAVARLGMMGNERDEAWKAYSREMARGDVPEVDLARGTNYFVTYAVDGKELELCVPEEYYIKSCEDAVGLLVYRGEQFMHFIPDVIDN